MKTLVYVCACLAAFWAPSAGAQVSFVIFNEGGTEGGEVAISADKAKFNTQENRSELTGNVFVNSDDTEFRSDNAIVQFLDESNDLETLTLIDNVYVELEDSRVYSDRGFYNRSENLVRLSGNVRYYSGRMEINGELFIYNTVTGEGELESVAGSIESN